MSERDLQRAKAAVEVARSHIGKLAPRALDAQQKKLRRRITTALRDAATARHGPWPQEDPIVTVYTAARQAVSQIDKLERTALDDQQRKLLSDATTALHEAEDALHDPFWRGRE